MDFWILISDAHRQKLKRSAEMHGVSVKEALARIVAFSKNDIKAAGNPAYMADCVTYEHIERVIDIL